MTSDRAYIGEFEPYQVRKAMHKETPKQKAKVKKVMEEYKAGELHSGSKKGPKVTSRRQGLAIALSEAGISRKKK